MLTILKSPRNPERLACSASIKHDQHYDQHVLVLTTLELSHSFCLVTDSLYVFLAYACVQAWSLLLKLRCSINLP